MTHGARLFLVILAFQFLFANPMPLEFPFIPQIDSHDLNGNGQPDFIAVNSSTSPRTLYHLEITEKGVEILWEYSMPKNKKGYFADMILDDFDNDGNQELIAVAYQDESQNIFYIFSTDAMGFYMDLHKVLSLNNTSTKIIQPRKLYSMSKDLIGQKMFILTQGSPNRQIIVCEYINGEINSVGSMGNKFLSHSHGPIEISLGNFDEDGIEDIFILSNGPNPTGYFIYSNGSEEQADLKDYPRILLLHEKGVDLNLNESDDLLMINHDGEFMSDLWGTKFIPLFESEIQEILVNQDNGVIHLISISQTGKIGQYTIDPLTRRILTSDYDLPKFAETEFTQVHSLVTADQIFLIHNGTNPELWSVSLAMELMTETPPPVRYQKIYSRTPDYLINRGNLFVHSIEVNSEKSLLNFTGEYLPSGMEFNLSDINLEWTPNEFQLGFHDFSYTLEVREKGLLEKEANNSKKVVRQQEYIIKNNYAHLVYVNDPVKFRNNKDHVTIVNLDPFEWIIPIEDKNVDTWLTVKKISGEKEARFQLLQPEIIIAPIDTSTATKMEVPDTEIFKDTLSIIIKESVSVDTVTESVYVDTVQTEFEGFAESKLDEEKDPFKKKKLETSVEDFKTKEEEYREKLKTHDKDIKDGKNVWIPKDSLNTEGDSIKIAEIIIEIHDTLTVPVKENIVEKVSEEPADTFMEESLTDMTIVKEEITKKAIQDTQFQEIVYPEIETHKTKFSWTPNTKPGNYHFTLTASDEYSDDTLNISVTIHPAIDLSMNNTKFIATVNQTFSTALELKQIPQSESYSYELISAPENMRITDGGVINWIPLATQVDDYSFNVEVTDGIAVSNLQYEIYVNAPPVISSRPPEMYFIHQGDSLSFPLESFDLNMNSELKWKLLSGPSDMKLNSQGVLKWMGIGLDHHPYEIQLSDGIDSIRWKGSIYVNISPIIISTAVSIISEKDNYEYPLSARDENNMSPLDPNAPNKVEFALAQGPTGMKLDEKNILHWNTDKKIPGEYLVEIIASDGAHETIQEFQLLVNTLPVIISNDSVAVEIGDTLSFQIQAYDSNLGDTLTYFMDTMQPGMDLDNNSGLLSWIPLKSDLGKHIFNLQVRDGHGTTGSTQEWQIFVYKAPKFTGDLLTEAFAGLEYSGFITAEDMYGQKLNNPESIIIESASFKYYNFSDYNHHFLWTPREVDIGNHEIIIRLTDESGFTTHHIHSLSVFMNPCIQCDNNPGGSPADTTTN